MKSMSNNSTFDLQKYLIENKLTTNSKLLKEIRIEPDWNVGRRDSVIKIEWGSRGELESIEEYLLHTNFETYCYEEGEQILEAVKEDCGEDWEDYVEEYSIGKPFFNAGMTACAIVAGEELEYTYILSSSLQTDVRTKLLNKDTPYYEINDIIDSLGIEYNQ